LTVAERQFGIPQGIEKRLAYWANQLSRNKSYPWVGTGIIDDLKCASKLLGAEDFDKLYPLDVGQPKPPQPVEEDDEFAAFYAAKAETTEYDL
jgi:hypothetical protein